jgi:hypothetical protein
MASPASTTLLNARRMNSRAGGHRATCWSRWRRQRMNVTSSMSTANQVELTWLRGSTPGCHRVSECPHRISVPACRQFEHPSATGRNQEHQILWSGVFPISAAQLRLAGAFLVQTHHEWQVSAGRVRANSAVDLLVTSIAGAPVLTAGAAATLIGRSYPQANVAIQRLASAGILSQTNVGRRNRAFEATEIINAFTDLERRAQQDSSGCGHSHGRHG